MSIVEVNQDDKKTFKYKELERKDLYKNLSDVLESCKEYVNICSDIKWTDIACDFPALSEIIVRIDKRKDYFNIFHEHTEMNETKEMALLAYWIIKFRPFSSKTELDRKYDHLNEVFAIYVLLSAIKEEADRDPDKSFFLSADYLRKLSYGFRYWDISKEAMMLISESLSEAMRCRKNK